MAEVVVYGKPACVACDATHRTLKKHGIPFSTVDISQDTAALEKMKELGYQQAPVVFVGDDDHWSGFRPDRLKELILV